MKTIFTLKTILAFWLVLLISVKAFTQSGTCLEFDGTDDFVAIEDMYYSTAGEITELTVCGWILAYPGEAGWSMVDFDRSEYYNVEIGWQDGTTDVVNFATYSASGGINDMAGTINVRDGQWHFIAAVYDGTDKYIYVDGIKDTSYTNPHSGSNLGKGTTRYGFVGDGSEASAFNGAKNNKYYKGSYDEISIWHEAKSAAELYDIMSNGIANPIIETNLMLYYQFDEGSGQVLTDASSNGYDGQLGATTNVDSSDPMWKSISSVIRDNMATFNGSSDYLYIVNTNDINTANNLANRTIEVWFKCDDISKSTKQVVFEEGGAINGFNIYIQSNTLYIGGWAEGNSWAGTYHSSTSISSNQWHHASLVLSSSAIFTAYLDGNEIGSTSAAKSLPKHTGDICIGRNGNTQFHDGDDNNINSFFDGSIDELRIWNEARVLDSIRVEIHQELEIPSSETYLVCNARFNQSSGTSIYDYSISGNNLIIGSSTNIVWESRTAPIPYYTISNGNLSSDNIWAEGQYAPFAPWANIVIDHDVILDSDFECQIMRIKNTGSLNINPMITLTVTRRLKNLAGTSGLVLKSGASGSASLIHRSNNVEATMETYFDLDAHYFSSSPIEDAVSYMFFDQYMFIWDEPNYEWSNFSETDVDLEVGKGYDVYNVDQSTATYVGTLNSGDESISGLTRTATGLGDPGFNLVGNPYPSCLDIAELDFGTDITAASYVLRHGQDAYYIWSQGTGGDLEARYIQPGQGFFVEVLSSNQSLDFTNAARTHAGLGPLDKKAIKENISELLKITLLGGGQDDRAYVGFRDQATTGFDHYYDVRKLRGSEESPYVFSYSRDFSEMGINAFPRPLNDEVTPIGVIIPEEGTYSLNFTQLYSFSDHQEFYLKDRVLHKYYDLREDSIIEFTYQNGQAERRFDLMFNKPTGISDITEDSDLVVYSNDKIIYLLSEELMANDLISFYNVLGQKVGEERVSDLKSGVSVDWPNAYYLMRMNEGRYSQKFYLK